MPAQLTDSFSLEGDELDLDQAEAIKSQGYALIEGRDHGLQVDLARLQRANSVTVAVLMAWYRHAALQQKTIQFVNLSQDLLNIIEFSGLRRLLLPNASNELQPQTNTEKKI